MMDHQHVDADGTGQDGIGAPGRVCCKEPVVLIPQRRRQGCKQPDVDAKALKHDKTLVKTLLETLCTLAQDRLIGIFQNRTKETRALDPNRTCPPFRPRAGMSGSKAPSTK